MTPSDEIRTLAFDVNDGLDAYVAVHNDLLARGWFRGIFVPIDFGANRRKLQTIAIALIKLRTQAETMRAGESDSSVATFLGILDRYVEQLVETIERLGQVVTHLERKAKGEQYDWATYKAQLAAYEDAVQKYRELGSAMNQAWNEMV